ncbi:MAG: class I SAM-dependent methyltransferase [Anaerolineales bacterium]|nr:class I SAM-dependent methyltransferase [Anaerolineales bacterium]
MGWLSDLLRFFYQLLYYPLAWAYDLVAWLVSLGHWNDWVASVAPRAHGPRLLELGHGPGHLQALLAGAKPFVVGLDLSPKMSRLAQRRLAAAGKPARLVRAQAQQLPFAAGSFDQVVATFPSEYIIVSASLQSIWRVLAPDGKLLVLPTAWLHIQPRHWNQAFADQLRTAGFNVQQEYLAVRASQAVLVTASKPAQKT